VEESRGDRRAESLVVEDEDGCKPLPPAVAGGATMRRLRGSGSSPSSTSNSPSSASFPGDGCSDMTIGGGDGAVTIEGLFKPGVIMLDRADGEGWGGEAPSPLTLTTALAKGTLVRSGVACCGRCGECLRIFLWIGNEGSSVNL